MQAGDLMEEIRDDVMGYLQAVFAGIDPAKYDDYKGSAITD